MTDQRTFAEELAPHFAAEQLAQLDPSAPHVMLTCLDCAATMAVFPGDGTWQCPQCQQAVDVEKVGAQA